MERQLVFNETVMSHEIEVPVINDGIAERREYFLAILTLLDPLLPSKVTIAPDLANVTIVDGTYVCVLHSMSDEVPEWDRPEVSIIIH